MAENKPATRKVEARAPTIPFDPHVPPRMVRRKRDGLITNWSSLFKSKMDEFEPYYRPGTDDQMQHEIQYRRFEAQQAFGTHPHGTMAGPPFGTSVGGDIIDAQPVDGGGD